MNKIVDGLKYWGQLFLLPIYGVSFLFPRDKKIWLFGSTFGKRFADNPRYLYLYVSQHKSELGIRPVWISQNKNIVRFLNGNGYEAYYYHSIEGIWFALRGKVYVFDNYSKDINFWQSGGAVKVNLWHGSGNKKTNYDNKFDKVRHPKDKWERFKYFLRRLSDEKPHHYTLATGPMMAEIFTSAFNTTLDHIIQEGYPRNDMLFDDNKIENLFLNKEKDTVNVILSFRGKGCKILVYMPTFRDSEKLFFKVMELEKFNKFLKKEKMIFFTKLHPKSKLKEEFSKVSYSNIVNIDADVDPYTFLKMCDLLITDYSSIYSDWLMLNRPSVLFPIDFEEYSNDTRECYFEYDEYMPEIKAHTMEDLMKDIKRVMNEDTYERGRIELRNKIFANIDGHSSERISGILKKKFT